MLKKRIITAFVLVACLIPALFKLPITFWAIAMLVISLFALYEWASMIKLTNMQTKIYLGLTLFIGLIMVSSLEQHGLHFFFYKSLIMFFVATLFWIIIVPFWLYFLGRVEFTLPDRS